MYSNRLLREKAENVNRMKEVQNTNSKIELETLRAKKPHNLADDSISQTELCEKVVAEPSQGTQSPRDPTIAPTATKEAPGLRLSSLQCEIDNINLNFFSKMST